MVRNAILGFILFFVFGLNLQAQKLGYVNVEALKSEMPEIASAESELKLYKMMLFEQGMIMVKALQKEYNIIQRRVSGSCLSPRDYQKMLVRIKIMTYELESFEASIPDRIQSLEAKLMNPILARIDSAVRAVATENQFQYILKKGSSAILYNDNTSDVSGLVRGKLGM